MNNIIINYFEHTILTNSIDEAVAFINSLTCHHPHGEKLICQDKHREIINNIINGNEPYIYKTEGYYDVGVTNSKNTWLKIYKPKADTLEEHNAILQAEKAEKERIEAEKKHKREQQRLAEMYRQAEGWYIVTLEALVSKIRGNDGVKCYSFKVLASSKMSAYEKAVDLVMKEGVNDRNVAFIYEVFGYERAYIEYVGVWTDEAELEYGS